MARGNEKKLEELILYISEQCADDPTFGAVKLNKILCYSDFLFYAYHDHGITDVEYQKLANGPAPRRLVPIRDRMIKRGDLALQPISLKSGYTQHRPRNLRKPNLDLFTGPEIATVQNVIQDLRGVTAEDTSDLSHQMVGWMVVEDGETIPYNTAYFANPPLSLEETFRARQLKAAKERGELQPRRRNGKTA